MINVGDFRMIIDTLDESHLDENIGLGGGAAIRGYGTRYYNSCPTSPAPPYPPSGVVNNANAKIDWNCDKTIEANTMADINGYGDGHGKLTSLKSFNDWNNLDFIGINPVSMAGRVYEKSPGFEEELSHELTVEEDRRIPPFPPADVVQNGNSISWTPVGLEIITAYRIYKVSPDRRRTLVMTVPSNAAAEELDRIAATVPDGRGIRYAITSLDHYGNESELALSRNRRKGRGGFSR